MKGSLVRFALIIGPALLLVLTLDLITMSQGMLSYPKMGDRTRNLFGYKSSRRCDCSCGLDNKKKARLIGGKVTQINEFPWTVALLYEGHYFCGGTLINQRYVLTAAHCIRGVNVTKVKALLGEHVRSFPLETRIKYYDVIYSVFHHRFDKSTYNNDIGLLKLSQKVPFRWHSRPACLPYPNVDYEGEFVTVTGWGKTSEDGEIVDSLMKIVVPAFSNEACKTSLNYKSHEITDNMICAGYYDGRKDSCYGDSGGGLLWKGTDGKIDVIGVVSWGHGCGREGLPGVYTRVSKYLEWIAYHTRDTCYCGRRQPRG